jgi:hypothetical protein
LQALHEIVQNWIFTFADMGALDAQFEEAKIAMGEVRTLGDLADTEWSSYWNAVQEVSDRNGECIAFPVDHGVSPKISLRPWEIPR